MPNLTKYASTLKNVVQELNIQQDSRLGRHFEVKILGNNEDNKSKIMFVLNCTEFNVNERRKEIEDILYDHMDKFINETKKEFKKVSGKALNLTDKKQDLTAQAANFAGGYIVTVITSFTSEIIKE